MLNITMRKLVFKRRYFLTIEEIQLKRPITRSNAALFNLVLNEYQLH